jgi:hypothetical protein
LLHRLYSPSQEYAMTRPIDRDPSHQPPTSPAEGWPREETDHAPDADERARLTTNAAAPGSPSTEPRGERTGTHSSQGLAGAQGSGGGAERGVNQPPPRRKESTGSAAARPSDNAGLDVAGDADKSD